MNSARGLVPANAHPSRAFFDEVGPNEAQMTHIGSAELRAGLRRLGLAGQPFCLHASLSSFGWVEGGAETLVDAFLAEGCTVMWPSLSAGYERPGFSVPPAAHLRPARNGTDYKHFSAQITGVGRVFTPSTNDIEPQLGAVVKAVVNRSGRVRGNHALNLFTAIGPLAHTLVDCQVRGDVYAPLTALAEVGGRVLLIGVGLTSMTLLHLAESLAGRRPFRWANGAHGQPVAWDVGSCSAGFDRLEPLLAPVAREAMVGASRWWSFPARETALLAAAAIRSDPDITHCPDGDCQRRQDAIAGGPLLSWHNLRRPTPG